ncbi:MAG TPA: prepilin-type N-terminal cleavage/methylation domain-containing protein [Planctomycetota bacterium]|nr:prepilin-type N-terminal cleavage/methylation domain-containing protein [Planctomycetota bacterium]
MRRLQAGITLVEVLAAATILAIVLALLIPVQAKARRYDDLMKCQDHLHTLYEAQSKAPPTKVQETGRAYWVRLTQTTPPLVAPDVLKCPFVEGPDAPFCQYYGPSGDVVKMDPKDPIGADMDQNHSADRKQGGNILLKSGEVVIDHASLWATMIQMGQVRP